MQVAKKSTRETIYDALVDCFNKTQRDVTREMLYEVTGIKKATIDEHLDKLIDEEQTVVRVMRGYFQPVIKFPETRAMSRTILPSGMNKVEIGDFCLDLTPAEGRKFGALFGGGDSVQESEAVQQNRVLVARYAVENKKMKAEIAALWDFVRQDASKSNQLKLDMQPICMA